MPTSEAASRRFLPDPHHPLAVTEVVAVEVAPVLGLLLGMTLPLRGQELSLREIAARLGITKGAKNGQHPSPATVMRMLREHNERTAGTEPVTAMEVAESA
ncbi:hypothetical protein ABZ923_36805 [Streptomyces sp. NPDC046881]|uniref:hypothetical protein n=1 Tax=Streptomyces sp. NPDC046881 TaxID=3155374 RepID=UPI0033FB75D1